MQLAYLVFSLVVSMLLAFAWRTDSLPNTCIKLVLILQSIWTFFMLLGTVAPLIQTGAMRLM